MIRPAFLFALVAAGPAAAQTQVQLDQQAGAAFRRADTALNIRYGAAMADAKRDGAGAASALLAAQRAWLAFRDAECARQSYGSRGGSIHGMEEVMCRTTLTRERTQQLKSEPR